MIKAIIYSVCALSLASLTLLYNGFCLREGRWLSEEELIMNAMQYAYKHYPPSRITIPNHGRKRITKPIVYNDFEDFVERNPDCCSLSDVGRKGLTVSTLSRLSGSYARFVRVEFRVDSETHHKNKGFIAVKNCGGGWIGF